MASEQRLRKAPDSVHIRCQVALDFNNQWISAKRGKQVIKCGFFVNFFDGALYNNVYLFIHVFHFVTVSVFDHNRHFNNLSIYSGSSVIFNHKKVFIFSTPFVGLICGIKKIIVRDRQPSIPQINANTMLWCFKDDCW
jgi:hypothetical protein